MRGLGAALALALRSVPCAGGGGDRGSGCNVGVGWYKGLVGCGGVVAMELAAAWE